MSVGGVAESEPDCTEGATVRFRVGDRWANRRGKSPRARNVCELTVGESEFVPIGGSNGRRRGPARRDAPVLKDGVEVGMSR
jgi:hypothetical protein